MERTKCFDNIRMRTELMNFMFANGIIKIFLPPIHEVGTFQAIERPCLLVIYQINACSFALTYLFDEYEVKWLFPLNGHNLQFHVKPHLLELLAELRMSFLPLF